MKFSQLINIPIVSVTLYMTVFLLRCYYHVYTVITIVTTTRCYTVYTAVTLNLTLTLTNTHIFMHVFLISSSIMQNKHWNVTKKCRTKPLCFPPYLSIGIKQPLVLRCLCPKVQAGLIPLRDLKSVWHLSPRPHCSKTEVMWVYPSLNW